MVYTSDFSGTKIYRDRSDAISLLHGLIRARESFNFTGHVLDECPNCRTTGWQIVTLYKQFLVIFLLPFPWYQTKFLVCTNCLGVSKTDEKVRPLISEFIQSSKPLIENFTQQIRDQWEDMQTDALQRLATFEQKGGRLEDLVVPTILHGATDQEKNKKEKQ